MAFYGTRIADVHEAERVTRSKSLDIDRSTGKLSLNGKDLVMWLLPLEVGAQLGGLQYHKLERDQ